VTTQEKITDLSRHYRIGKRRFKVNFALFGEDTLPIMVFVWVYDPARLYHHAGYCYRWSERSRRPGERRPIRLYSASKIDHGEVVPILANQKHPGEAAARRLAHDALRGIETPGNCACKTCNGAGSRPSTDGSTSKPCCKGCNGTGYAAEEAATT
jgi:hypothetical protein